MAGWAADMAEGRNAAMYAWRRDNVAELNRLARQTWRAMGRLATEELNAPGGATYAVGDRVVALAPGAMGKVVTSETGTVIALDPGNAKLTIRMDDGDAVRHLQGEEIGADRLAHGYAVTVHRSQGATVERAHALEDGGGRELAYVKMSRATDRSTVYVVADSLEQAVEDLSREWRCERRLRWAIDQIPTTLRRVGVPRRDVTAALHRGGLLAERRAILAAVPTDPTAAIRFAERELDRVRRRRADLEEGRGTYANHPVNRAVLDHQQAQENVARLQANVAQRLSGRRRREIETELRSGGRDWLQRRSASTTSARRSTGASAKVEAQLTRRLTDLYEQREQRAEWLASHPEAARRLDRIERDVEAINHVVEGPPAGVERGGGSAGHRPLVREAPVAGRDIDIGLGL